MFLPLHDTRDNLALIDSAARAGESALSLTLSAAAASDPAWKPLLDRLEKDGFPRAHMLTLFGNLGESAYSPAFMGAKITELYGVRGMSLNSSEETEPELPEGYKQPLSDVTVGEYRTFTVKYAETLKDLHKQYGVDQNIIVALLLVETGLGSNLGKTPALRALASMAVVNTPTMLAGGGNAAQGKRINAARLSATLKSKSEWAYKELRALIAYGQKNNADISKIPGSVYGAVGICQFMPSNIEPYGVDGDKDGKVDLFSVVDAMYSAANYLEQHGWRGAKTQEAKLRVLRAYNQDYVYAAKVLGTSNQLALADKGKIAAGRNPVVHIPGGGQGYRDPSLRGRRIYVPPSARIKSLGSYGDLLR